MPEDILPPSDLPNDSVATAFAKSDIYSSIAFTFGDIVFAWADPSPQFAPYSYDTLWRVLPRSATKLERDLLTVTRTDYLQGYFKLINRVKREIKPAPLIPLILIEYGFEEAAILFTDHGKLLDTAIELRGKWGTPFAVESMAKLMNYTSASIWEEPAPTIHFPEFQLNLGGDERSLNRLVTLFRLVNVVKPLRCRFRRVFNAWDDRQMLWDDSFMDSNWDDESGVDVTILPGFGSHSIGERLIVSCELKFVNEVYMEALNASMEIYQYAIGESFP